VKEIIIGIAIEAFEKTIGKIFFPKTRARYRYRERLKDIVEGFVDCMGDRTTCSLNRLINEAKRRVSRDEERVLQQLSKRAELLKEIFQSFRHDIEITYLRNLKELFEKFRRILSNCYDIFKEFCLVLREHEEIVNSLKKDPYGYPTFKRLYNSTLTKFEDLTREASKDLKEIEPVKLLALPDL